MTTLPYTGYLPCGRWCPAAAARALLIFVCAFSTGASLTVLRVQRAAIEYVFRLVRFFSGLNVHKRHNGATSLAAIIRRTRHTLYLTISATEHQQDENIGKGYYCAPTV